MTNALHEEYAKDLLISLADDNPDVQPPTFTPNPAQSRNAAKAMTTILCHRLFKNSMREPKYGRNTTYEWKGGVFNCRNIADRDYFWTNMRRKVADEIHEIANSKAVAYLLACSVPSETKLSAWVLPEPLLYSSLSVIPEKTAGDEYTIQIRPTEQRIEGFATCPALDQYFKEFILSRTELQILKEARQADASVRQQRKDAKAEGQTAVEAGTKEQLVAVSEQLNQIGTFDPSGMEDARERLLSSIVRRRGQPAFRKRLLAAYNGRCAISGCDVEAVLDAAHIVPYKGPDTNHPGNGVLLRTDIHTLFDLKLIAVDAETMTVLVSPELAGTCYEDFQGRQISIPRDGNCKPSSAAIDQHRHDSDL